MARIQAKSKPKKRRVAVMAPVPPLTDDEIAKLRELLGVIEGAPSGSMFFAEDGVLVAFGPPTVKSAISPNSGELEFDPI